VIWLILYIFVYSAWVAGQFLWRIQDKVNRLALEQRVHGSQPSEGRRTTAATRTSDTDLQSEEKIQKLRKLLGEAKGKKGDLCDAAPVARRRLRTIGTALRDGHHDSDGDANANRLLTARNALEKGRQDVTRTFKAL
jgi:hypothetical protein